MRDALWPVLFDEPFGTGRNKNGAGDALYRKRTCMRVFVGKRCFFIEFYHWPSAADGLDCGLNSILGYFTGCNTTSSGSKKRLKKCEKRC